MIGNSYIENVKSYVMIRSSYIGNVKSCVMIEKIYIKIWDWNLNLNWAPIQSGLNSILPLILKLYFNIIFSTSNL